MKVTLENIIALASAGFSKNEILQVVNANNTKQVQSQPPVQQPVTTTGMVQGGAVQGSAGQASAGQDLAELIRSMQGSITGLTNAVQANNILNSAVPTHTETAEDVLASIINPPVVDNN